MKDYDNEDGKKEMRQKIELNVNGKVCEVFVEPWKTLLEVLREDLGLTGAKMGCDDGNCGVCTVILDGKAIKSCLMLALQAKGKNILTIEGLGHEGNLHVLQQAFIDHFAVQCGFCTPGMILAAKALLDENPMATEDDIRRGLHGNICRCTGYVKIVEAILAAEYRLAQNHNL
jgi:carbon-monoxide dehydrogenase small subunit